MRRFMTERAEGEFHVRYEKALELVRSEFGRKYPMVIGGSEVWTSQTVPQYSPIDTRLLLARLPAGGAQHAKKAVAAAKKSFETWGRSDFRERVKIMRAAADIMSEKKFELAAWYHMKMARTGTKPLRTWTRQLTLCAITPRRWSETTDMKRP